MTDILTRDPNDSDEFPLGIGEQRTVIMRVDTGEATQRIDPRLIKAPSFDAIPRRIVDIDDTVIYMPATIGLAGPQSPPPPLPPVPIVPPKYDPAETQVHTILDSLTATLDGELAPAAPPSRRSVPYVIPAGAEPWFGARHRKPAPLWTRAAITVGGAMAVGGGLGLAIILAVVR